jgi:hypothetical protein
MKSYRMVSWWLRQDALPWPNEMLQDQFRRRADQLAKAGADSAIIFGAHFRWDFCKVWSPLHELIKFVADELHSRGMILFDHHSSVLTCYYNRDPGRFAHTYSNHAQVLISPPTGTPLPENELNAWKMTDIITGQPAFLPQYGAQEFCMNNQEFAAAYSDYLRRLVVETGIDGLMSDDALFYPRFRACGCQQCRERFRREYNHLLPATDDFDFWGNWENSAWRDWVQMRYQTTQDFFAQVSAALPPGMPLMSCCSGCSGAAANASALSYLDFIAGGANTVMLEMCGNTPSANGGINAQLASQAHLRAIARQNNLPCIGLGYGFSEDAARSIWAFNKFLGTGTWFSSLVHRLGLTDENMKAMPDDSQLLAETFQAELRHTEWFQGDSAAEIAVFFSTATQRFYGGQQNDYAADYTGLCQDLFARGYDADVVLEMPSPENSPYSVLLVPSAVCLSESETTGLLAWVKAGRLAMALGPLGFFDARGNRLQRNLADVLDVPVNLPRLKRTPAFPDNCHRDVAPAECVSSQEHWTPHPQLHWFLARCRDGLPAAAAAFLRQRIPAAPAEGWYCRKYRDRQGRLLMHFLAQQYDQELDDILESRRNPNSRAYRKLRIVKKIRPSDSATRRITLAMPYCYQVAELLMPLAEPSRRTLSPHNGAVSFSLPDDCAYFVLRMS